MPQNRTYRPGSFYRNDDRTGFKTPAENTVKEWTGRIVRNKSYEPRHPQDFVRGVRDDQSVPDARPRPAPLFTGPSTYLITTPSVAGSSILNVKNTMGLVFADLVIIMLDNGNTFYATVASVSVNQININQPLPYSTGNFDNEMLVTLLSNSFASGSVLETDRGIPITTEDGQVILVE
jgi:hypothetical protein